MFILPPNCIVPRATLLTMSPVFPNFLYFIFHPPSVANKNTNGHDLIYAGSPRASCENLLAHVFPDPASDAHLLPTTRRLPRSCPDFQNLQPSATPCLPLAVRNCTTSVHKETCSCCPSLFPFQR